MEKLQTCEFLALLSYLSGILACWILGIVQMGFEWRDAGVAVRGERVI